jgi:hypothetical protein
MFGLLFGGPGATLGAILFIIFYLWNSWKEDR